MACHPRQDQERYECLKILLTLSQGTEGQSCPHTVLLTLNLRFLRGLPGFRARTQAKGRATKRCCVRDPANRRTVAGLSSDVVSFKVTHPAPAMPVNLGFYQETLSLRTATQHNAAMRLRCSTRMPRKFLGACSVSILHRRNRPSSNTSYTIHMHEKWQSVVKSSNCGVHWDSSRECGSPRDPTSDPRRKQLAANRPVQILRASQTTFRHSRSAF